MRILVIDDHQGVRDEIRRILMQNGHDADAVGSADAAIPLIETGNYDFALLDYQMPEHDGLWLMRNTRIPPRTKVVLVTIHTNHLLISEMFKAGVVGYLIKPFDEDDLLRHLAYHSNRHEGPAAQAPGPAGLRDTAAANRECPDGAPAARTIN
ncbi:MAG: response regulator [Kiritimatiellae bacterium]|nr:response regulator [Kiritimatiellia bacterium]